MISCLNDRLQKQLTQLRIEFECQMKSVAQVDDAIRSQIWSQYSQEIREGREHALESLNRQWYNVQAVRRNAYSHTDQVLLYPKDKSQRDQYMLSYNTEVSALAAVSKHEGFPAAPLIKGATAAEIGSDLDAIRVRVSASTRSSLSIYGAD